MAGKDRRIVLSCPYTRRIPVIWRRNGRIIFNSKNTMLSYGTLVLRPVQLDVEGLYECRSQELFGSKYRAVFNVSINGNSLLDEFITQGTLSDSLFYTRLFSISLLFTSLLLLASF